MSTHCWLAVGVLRCDRGQQQNKLRYRFAVVLLLLCVVFMYFRSGFPAIEGWDPVTGLGYARLCFVAVADVVFRSPLWAGLFKYLTVDP